jgi:phosphotransferase system HPr-like phosphotransfer protein
MTIDLEPIVQIPLDINFEDGYSCANVIVRNEWGIHGRPSAMICKTANRQGIESYLTKFKQEVVVEESGTIRKESVSVEDTGKRYPCNQMLELMQINSPRETHIRIHVKGKKQDSLLACRELYKLIGAENLEEMGWSG